MATKFDAALLFNTGIFEEEQLKVTSVQNVNR